MQQQLCACQRLNLPCMHAALVLTHALTLHAAEVADEAAALMAQRSKVGGAAATLFEHQQQQQQQQQD